ncbi:helix-turn-helix domain-containing protein [Streptomyces sp. IBSNAI002]|uniref:helix-turn-helix domain-containing protein n=1 Tax=Streptomyces sp. IBSNAI002 TaxID=3457500 RepID=UPI003FD6AF42
MPRTGTAKETTVDKGKRITGVARETLAAQLKTDYEGGASIRSLANSTGRSYGFVHRILTETGVTLRARGGAIRPKPGA